MEGTQTVLWIVQQAMSELGLPTPREVSASQDDLVRQFVSLLNRCGYELVQGYPWEQLDKEWVLTTEVDKTEYALPPDWSYFLDQTQWDRTNHWPLLGPKTPQEWQWLKGGILSSGPRLRYRVWKGKFCIFPVPQEQNQPASNPTSVFAPWTIAMEYISRNWLASATQTNTTYDLINDDTNICLLDPWVVAAYLKLKFRQAKGLDDTSFKEDFVNIFWSRTGKNKGGQMLTLAPRPRTMLIGINNIPDGSWNVGNGIGA